ncbi:MAG: glycerol-3-phosphate acyltransferase, partial [Parachlamydiales bacterium]
PPETIQVELGEIRKAKRGKIHLAFGPEIDMENFPGSDIADKHQRREAKADYICGLVRKSYAQLS